MRLNQLRVGMQFGQVIIIHLRRVGAYMEIEFTDGKIMKCVKLHKEQSFAAALTGALASQSLDHRTMERAPVRPRVSDPKWRGERAGKRGEKLIADYASWDSRALTERKSRA